MVTFTKGTDGGRVLFIVAETEPTADSDGTERPTAIAPQ
jgi:hypothetical protein